MTIDLHEFEQLLGRQFADTQVLRQALTHRSFANEVSETVIHNERLEFLGDSVLDFLAAELVYQRFPGVTEGELTRLRSALVRTESLARLATEIRLGDFLFTGKGEKKFTGRPRQNLLCRGFEAVIGAMFVDAGLDTVRGFILPRFAVLLHDIVEQALYFDARSVLQEKTQAEIHITPTYRVIGSEGPEHEKNYIVQVVIGETLMGEGKGRSKRAASQAAAEVALQKIIADGWGSLVTTVTLPPNPEPTILDEN
jgi:ribonuclease-3